MGWSPTKGNIIYFQDIRERRSLKWKRCLGITERDNLSVSKTSKDLFFCKNDGNCDCDGGDDEVVNNDEDDGDGNKRD